MDWSHLVQEPPYKTRYWVKIRSDETTKKKLKQLLGHTKEITVYCKSKEEAIDRRLCRIRFEMATYVS